MKVSVIHSAFGDMSFAKNVVAFVDVHRRNRRNGSNGVCLSLD